MPLVIVSVAEKPKSVDNVIVDVLLVDALNVNASSAMRTVAEPLTSVAVANVPAIVLTVNKPIAPSLVTLMTYSFLVFWRACCAPPPQFIGMFMI